MRLFDFTYDKLVIAWCADTKKWSVTGVKEPYSDEILSWHKTRDAATIAAKEFAFAPDFESHQAFKVQVLGKRGQLIHSDTIPSWDHKHWFDRLSAEKKDRWLYAPNLSQRYRL